MRIRFAALLLSLPVLATPVQAQFDACVLLTPAEIKEVQGETITEAKSSTPARKGFAVSQCFYVANTFAKSVSLEVTQRDSSALPSLSPKDDWQRLFHPPEPAADKNAANRGRKGEKKPGPPVKVKGVGDEAFWMGDRVAGALYVLKGDAYFRISIGGWGDESLRMKKTKTLAKKVLKRL